MRALLNKSLDYCNGKVRFLNLNFWRLNTRPRNSDREDWHTADPRPRFAPARNHRHLRHENEGIAFGDAFVVEGARTNESEIVTVKHMTFF